MDQPVRETPRSGRRLNWGTVNELFEAMERDGAELFSRAGVAPADVHVTRSAEMRLLGQLHEIEVPLPPGRLGPSCARAVHEVFVATYERLYHYTYRGNPIMAITWRVRLTGPRPTLASPSGAAGPVGSTIRANAARPAYFPERGGLVETPVYLRRQVPTGAVIEGPAIIEEEESTTVIPPGDVARIDHHRNIRVTIDGSA